MVSGPLTTLVVLLQMLAAGQAPAVSRHPAEITIVSSDADSKRAEVGLNEVMGIDLSADIREILIADQEIVKVVLRSTRRVYLVGITVGKTNVYFYDSAGDQIGALDVWVSENLESPASDTEESQQRDPVTHHFPNEVQFWILDRARHLLSGEGAGQKWPPSIPSNIGDPNGRKRAGVSRAVAGRLRFSAGAKATLMRKSPFEGRTWVCESAARARA